MLYLNNSFNGLRILLLLCLVTTSLYAKPPHLTYVKNQGQWLPEYLYKADVPGGNFFLTPEGFSYILYNTETIFRRHHGLEKNAEGVVRGNWQENGPENQIGTHRYSVNFVGGNLSRVQATKQVNTNYNYYLGNDPKHWASNVKGYEELNISEVYPLVDLKLYSRGSGMKYDLVVKKGGNVSDITLQYEGVEDIEMNGENLLITTSVSTIEEYRPYAYQVIGGKEVEVPCSYNLHNEQLSFDFPNGYNEDYELIIDPLLIFSTYSGSAADNWGNCATYGEHGKLYSGGITNHERNGTYLGEFPATDGAYQTEYGGVWDLAIIKYDSSGSEMEYATYLGGSASEVPVSMIMNSKEELLIYGITNSTDFPVTADAYQSNFNGGTAIATILGLIMDNGADAFVVKLSKDGSQLLSSTYLGGNGNDGINETNGALTKNYGDQQRGEIFIDEADNVYIGGSTSSTDLFQSVTSFDPAYHGGATDAFVAKFDENLSQLQWGGYLGGSKTDTGFAIKVDSKNDVFVAGGTNSTNFNLLNNPAPYHGNIDGWVVRISADSLKVNSGAYLGTSYYDQIYFLDLDSNDDVYVLGQTTGNYPITSGVYSNSGGGQFIHRLSNDLQSTVFSTVFGSTGRFEPNISPTAFLVNDCNNLYVAGWGNTQGNFALPNYVSLSTVGLPTTSDALKSETTGDDFYLMVLDADATNLLYATFFGGGEALVHVDGGTSRFDKSGIVYHSVCASCTGGSTFPTTDGAWSNVNGAYFGCNNAAFKFDLASLRAIIQTNNTTLTKPGYNIVCMPDSIVFQNLSIGGEYYEWNFGDGIGVTRTDTAYMIYQYSAPGNYTVTLKAVDPNTCIAEDITTTNVRIIDPMQYAADDPTICVNEDIQLIAFGGTKYEWISADSSFTSNENKPIVMPQDTTTYYVKISDANCQTLDTLTVNVVPEVPFDYSVSTIYDCINRPSVKLENRDTENKYLWDLGDGNTSEELDLTYNYEEDGVYNIRLTGTLANCAYNRDVPVHISTVKVPNVFTPGDGNPNAFFEVISDGKEEVKIFDRWGKLIYENSDYQDDWAGENVSAGVYYYQVKVVDRTTCKGWVQVLK